MFAPPVPKPKANAALPKDQSAHQRAAVFDHHLHHDGTKHLAAFQRSIANQVSRQNAGPERLRAEEASSTPTWDFSTVPPFPPNPMRTEQDFRPAYSRSFSAASPTGGRRFTSSLRAIVKGRQRDALSADRHVSPRQSEPGISQSVVSEPTERKPQHKSGEPVPIPNGALQSISGTQADSVTSHLNYVSSIKNEGPPPADFGLTNYAFVPENFSYNHYPGAPATPGGSGSAGNPATPASFEVTGEIQGAITYALTNLGRTDIASDSDSSITQANYQKVVADLTPPAAPVVHAGRRLMKNQPFRDHFYARDLTERHELFHCREDDRFGGQGVQAAQAWLNTQTANSERELFALLAGITTRIGNAVTAGRAAPADEQRAYDDGAPFYLARAQAIQRKGNANGYAPQPAPAPAPAPAPKP